MKEQDFSKEETLIDELGRIWDRIDEIKPRSTSFDAFDESNDGSAIGDTGRLTDDQDSYDAAIDQASLMLENDELDTLYKRAEEIEAELSSLKQSSNKNSSSEDSSKENPF